MAYYANIIIDISTEKLDKTFQYKIPEELFANICPGVKVNVPFGKGGRSIHGFVVEVTDKPEYDVNKIKDIDSVVEGSIPIESQLIALAAWIRRNYGATMNQALKTVIPVKKQTKQKENRRLFLALGQEEAMQRLEEFKRKHNTARARLLEELIQQKDMEYGIVTQKLNVSSGVIKSLEEQGILTIQRQQSYRNPIGHLQSKGYHISLNEYQQQAVDIMIKDVCNGYKKTYLLHGITGSGKTEVYMELIAKVILMGKQAIVLIPEIALTYQTVMRFYNRFGDRVSIMNSKLSQGERYDQFLRAKHGEVDIMIGPRSALFTPFLNLGLIIIDEEHEGSYKSETLPRYHARETAIRRGEMTGASVVLGSATPSVDSYFKAMNGEYELLELNSRIEGKSLPTCEVVDLRDELKKGNRSILSISLQEKIEQRLLKKEQVMLFINRRGMSSFVSCRACGHVMKCPHCDVSLSLHNNGQLKCHYCGYMEQEPKACPTCGSKYISGFKAGTQKIEEVVKKRFGGAKTLRMDFDTTRNKDSYEQILSAFANHEADILIGTQMIVKGHDFPNVTLVGVLAADLSMYVSDYRAGERTFQLLTQAAGRAGRGEMPGDVVIQTYNPTHYSILTAEKQDYHAFFQQEIAYRKLLSYPPVCHMLLILVAGKVEEEVFHWIRHICEAISKKKVEGLVQIGPSDASVAKINDIYRKVLYIKHRKYDTLVQLKDEIEQQFFWNIDTKKITITFDFNPMNGC